MNFVRYFLTGLSTRRWNDTAILFLRLFIGAMMLTHGIGKIQQYDYLVGSFPDPLGIGSATSFALITIAEVGFSVAIMIGIFTRLSAIGLAFGMFVATFVAFPDKSFADGELSFVYMGIYIFLIISGGGEYSLDRLFFAAGQDDK